MSQKSQILAHLMEGKTINPLQSLDLFGCRALNSRISELRNDDGWTIKDRRLNLPSGSFVYEYYMEGS